MIILAIIIVNQSIAQDASVGSWIVSSDYNGTNQGFTNYKLDFNNNGININPIVLASESYFAYDYYSSFAFTMGAFSECNGYLDAYVFEKYYYDSNDDIDQWANANHDWNITNEAQIIPSPYSGADYLLFYCANDADGQYHNYSFRQDEINIINGYPNFSYFPFDFEYNSPEYGAGLTAFAITNYDNDGDRFIVTVTGGHPDNFSGTNGLELYKIDSEADLESVLLEDSQSNELSNGFGPSDYYGYNLELKDKDNTTNPTAAWITRPNPSNPTSKIFVYNPGNNLGDHYVIDLSSINAGFIAGIEFSPFADEQDYMYVSTQLKGIIKINWVNGGSLVHQYTSASNPDFCNTYVQTAPNGNLYFVSNDGRRFGEIDKGAGHSFNSTAFTYPNYATHNNYRRLSDNTSGIKFYTLPENEESYNFSFNELVEINNQSSQNIPSLSDMTWDANDNFPNNTLMFEHGFILTDNVTLTVNDMTLEFNQLNNAKVIIEPGSKLIVNGSVLTNHHCYEPAKWDGIEVWGDPNHNQDPKPGGGYFQGYLEISNSTIEHAQTAVALRKDSTWASYGGGIVKAHNVNFLNNAKSVHFAPYQNMFFRTNGTDTLEFEMLNESRFELCDFVINGNYLEDSDFFKIADIVQVNRIPFLGCDFILDNNSEYISPYNSGIAAYSAGVNVDNYQDSTSSFTGFYTAVVSNNDFDKTYYSMVWNSDFINNSVGIRNTGTNNFKIIDNHFEIGENNGGKGACGWAPGYGVDIREASLYVIENNSFIPYQGNTGNNYGVRLYETATDYTEVYNNEYDNLTIANLSEGLNTFGGDDDEGAAYLCNDHDGNNIDILITGDVEEEIEIHRDNGSEYYASGNTFSSNASMHIQNDGQEIINFYCKGIQTPDPTRCTPIYIDLDSAASLNTCPDHYGGSGGGIGLDPIGRQAKEDEFNDAKLNYNAVESLYEGLTDGGDTEGTELTIAAAQPGDTWELRANLLGMSPYLSKEVLIEAADITDVLPESVLFEILSANPDELRKADLLDYLENKEEPLPEYMINILQQMATGTTAKTALLREMRSYKRDKIKAASEIIHSILIEDELDHEDLRTWLANLESYNGDRQIISSFIAQGDINSAQALMDLLPELYELNGDALSDHNEWADLMNMQLNWQAEGRNPMNLTEAELATLYNLADNGGTKAKYQARGILEHFYGEDYIDCCTPPDGNKSTVADFSKNDLAKAMGLSMEAHPNPAKEYTEISYTLPFGVENADLLIFDLSGRLIDQKQLYSPINKVAYNTSDLPAGSYTIEIKTNDYSFATKLIIQ